MSNAQTGVSAGASSAAGQRPVSKAEASNPREFQLNQLRRRFHPTETSNDDGTTLSFGLAPSDPDFPFDMDKLQCILHIPGTYPVQGRPSIKVTNPEMGSAFQENISRGFDDIVDSTIRSGSRGTLLSWMNSLDRHLERLLTTTERGPTLKFVPNVGGKGKPEEQKLVTKMSSLAVSSGKKANSTQVEAASPQPPKPVYTAEEKAQAEKRRTVETKQLDARLGRLPLYQKSSDGLSFVIPIQPTKLDRLPISVRSVKTVKLLVPSLYPLEPSTVHLQGIDSPEGRAVEAGFSQWLEGNKQLNLVSQVNYLTSNMHKFAKTPLKAPEPAPVPVVSDDIVPSEPPSQAEGVTLEDKPHVHVVPRPPEWAVGDNGSDTDDSEMTPSEDEFSDDDEEEGGAPVPDLPEPTTAERGVALSFPFLELYGIELLELVGLYITIKCDRCKEQLDVRNIPQIRDKSDELSPKIESCKKCANTMSLVALFQPVRNAQQHFPRLVLLQFGAKVPWRIADNVTAKWVCVGSSKHGPSAYNYSHENSRSQVSESGVGSIYRTDSSRFREPPRKKPKEVLGIVAGQELPRRGRCTHYGKSYRWFSLESDPNDYSGFCSREQIYRPENCGICRAVLIGKAGSGFWEGGKGTRNRVLMSRKDPRKYKRRGGTTPGGASSSKK
ncbi:CHY zinc finger domain protein [Aspergillus luchuensis]|uniref:CHY zinc finger domain protein n=1 Tax=Aspergillus kawachii TaxID=1069201 RepID=A0A146F862_ASPKA|nr:CHY zinc finger domain protein [Aspergillus luchuensis]